MNRLSKSCGLAALSLAALLGLPASAQAAVTISIGKVKVPAGVTAEVGIFASSNSSDVISGFNLPLDINDDGTNPTLPTGFTLDTTPIQNQVYTNTGFDTPTPQITLINVDGIPTGSGPNIQLTAAPILLFDLAIDVSPSTPVGTVMPLEIEVPNNPFSTLFNVAGPSSPTIAAPINGTPVFGSITIVPEPSLVCLLLPGALLFRRRLTA